MTQMKAMVLAVLLLAVTPAGAMTGLEFLAFDKSASDQAAVMEPLVRQFVREGYHNVPDWSELAYMARALMLEKGYHDNNIAGIAKEAAITHGMSK
jgi:predicted lipoprotein